MSRVQQGVSEYRSYSLRQTRLLALYNKIPKQLLVGYTDIVWTKRLDIYSCQYSFLGPVTELLKMTDREALLIIWHFCLLFGRNFVILLPIISARLMNN